MQTLNTKKILIKSYYLITNPFRKIYRFIFRPKTRGSKCVIEFDGKILLARISYAHKLFTFPGGKVKKNETFEDGAKREVFEEVGVELGKLVKIGEYRTNVEYKRDTVEIFYSKADSDMFKIDDFEISEAGWFSTDNLPKERARSVNNIIDMYKKFKNEF